MGLYRGSIFWIPPGVWVGTPVVPFYPFGFWVPIYNIPTEKRVPLL